MAAEASVIPAMRERLVEGNVQEKSQQAEVSVDANKAAQG
jgi:hypothetical protein